MIKKLFPLATLLLLLSSCTNDIDNANIQLRMRAGQMPEFYATIEGSSDAETKVFADSKMRVLWNAGDQITIFNKNSYNQPYRFKGEDGDNAGGFAKVATDDEFATGGPLSHIYSVYPYAAATKISYDGIITLSLPALQHYKENSFGIGANTMVSATDDGMLQFRNAGGYLSFRLFGQGVSIQSITVKGNNHEKLAGVAKVTMPVGGIPEIEMMETAVEEVTLDCEVPVALGSTANDYTEFWFVIPPTTFSQGLTVTVTDIKGDVFEKSTSKEIVIARNRISHMAPIDVSQTQNLSKNGTANSYIVNTAGRYKFDATVKGNSKESIGTPVKAEVVWESFNTDVTPEKGAILKDVKFADGFVSFETSGANGNALIAVKDNNDVILWSWHIWATPYNPDKEFDIYSGSGAEMMNRNLGALSNTPGEALANGLFYQWGRKDPFLGSSSINQSITCAAIPEGVANQLVSKTAESGTIDYTTKHPTHFISVQHYDWMNNPDYTLWAIDKTKYDPCPPGWKVPTAGVFAAWEEATVDSEHYGILWGTKYSSPATWFPFSGQIFGSLRDVGKVFDHWTVTNNGSAAVSPHAGPDYYNLTTYYDMSGIGQSIRCVRESYQDTPLDNTINLSASETANCYIVPSSGAYKFKAIVKGNSTESVGTPVKAEVLWESFNTDVAPKAGDILQNVTFNNGYVSFTATGIRGNALIAVKDNSDAILWSWHIWATDYNPEEQYCVYTGGTAKMMDRNMGALSNTPGDARSLGFYYQWGRKDPFPSSSDISTFTMMATIPEAIFGEIARNENTGTVAYSIGHPTVAIVEKENDNHFDWMEYPNSTLWTESKTIYDPCPAGWRIPAASAFAPLAETSDYTRDTQNHVVTFGSTVSTPSTFFPCCGTDPGGHLNSDEFSESCHYWTGSIWNAYDSRRFCIYKYSEPSIDYISFRSHGFPVRCCKDE